MVRINAGQRAAPRRRTPRGWGSLVLMAMTVLCFFYQIDVFTSRPFHRQTASSASMSLLSEKTWDAAAIHKEFERALQKIHDAPIVHEPFDHFFVPQLFSGEFYGALMKELPSSDTYTKQSYAGTAPTYKSICLSPDLKNQISSNDSSSPPHIHIPSECTRGGHCWQEKMQYHATDKNEGMILTVNHNTDQYPLWRQMFQLVHSKNFTDMLYSKFAIPSGIPEWKQQEVRKFFDQETGHIQNIRNSAAVRIDPTSYHLSPHIDMWPKLVTWQYFHPETNELENRNVGTQFFKLKSEYQHLIEMEEKKNPAWLDYSFFDQVKEHKVVPNYFFSFAPNNRSWHGAAIDPTKMEGVNPHARRTFLGFLTSQEWKYHHFNSKDYLDHEFFYTREQ